MARTVLFLAFCSVCVLFAGIALECADRRRRLRRRPTSIPSSPSTGAWRTCWAA